MSLNIYERLTLGIQEHCVLNKVVCALCNPPKNIYTNANDVMQ